MGQSMQGADQVGSLPTSWLLFWVRLEVIRRLSSASRKVLATWDIKFLCVRWKTTPRLKYLFLKGWVWPFMGNALWSSKSRSRKDREDDCNSLGLGDGLDVGGMKRRGGHGDSRALSLSSRWSCQLLRRGNWGRSSSDRAVGVSGNQEFCGCVMLEMPNILINI